jgi:hypothetical protein
MYLTSVLISLVSSSFLFFDRWWVTATFDIEYIIRDFLRCILVISHTWCRSRRQNQKYFRCRSHRRAYITAYLQGSEFTRLRINFVEYSFLRSRLSSFDHRYTAMARTGSARKLHDNFKIWLSFPHIETEVNAETRD